MAGQVLRGHAELVEAVAFAPDGALFASGADDNTARLWRSDGQSVAILTGHSADVNGVAWSPDGTFVSTASGDGTFRTWMSDGILASTLKGHTDVVMGAAWLADSVSLVSASWDGTLRLWHAVRAENTRTIAAYNAKIWALDLSAEGDRLGQRGHHDRALGARRRGEGDAARAHRHYPGPRATRPTARS